MSQKKQVNVFIDPESLAALDRIADRIADGNRSEAVRRLAHAVDLFFANGGTLEFQKEYRLVPEVES